MIIERNNMAYLESLTPIFNDYRATYVPMTNEADTKIFLEKLIRNDEAVTFIALDEESHKQVMGFANLYPCYSSLALKRLWILNDLFVAGEYRGKGVSKALIERVIAFAHETGAVRIELKTDIENEIARSLYQSVGFKIDKEHVYYRVSMESITETRKG